jgi:L-lactate utilization protein LutC
MTYDKLAPENTVKTTVTALNSKGYETYVLKDRQAALNKIIELIPHGASVMNGSSITLEQIGFVEYLKSGKHGWKNLHELILAEKDEDKQANLRKQSVLSDFYLGSVHALTENGEFIIASNTGSQLPHIVFTSPNLIFVVSTKKIVANLTEAMERLEKYIIPLENKRMLTKYGMGTSLNKIVIFKNENQMLKRKVFFVLVQEDLGF